MIKFYENLGCKTISYLHEDDRYVGIESKTITTFTTESLSIVSKVLKDMKYDIITFKTWEIFVKNNNHIVNASKFGIL
jgi:hypothetical protein